MSDDIVSREELRSAIEARKELGEEMEPAVIDAFVERIERRLAKQDSAAEKALKRKRDHQKEMVLGSMGIAIPMLAIAAIFTGIQGLIAVCVALVAIAIARPADGNRPAVRRPRQPARARGRARRRAGGRHLAVGPRRRLRELRRLAGRGGRAARVARRRGLDPRQLGPLAGRR